MIKEDVFIFLVYSSSTYMDESLDELVHYQLGSQGGSALKSNGSLYRAAPRSSG